MPASPLSRSIEGVDRSSLQPVGFVTPLSSWWVFPSSSAFGPDGWVGLPGYTQVDGANLLR